MSFAVASSACTGTFDKKVAEMDKLRADHDRAAAEREKDLKAQIDHLQLQMSEADRHIATLTVERDESHGMSLAVAVVNRK